VSGSGPAWSRVALVGLLAASLALYLHGNRWGLPNTNPWHGDDVAKETLVALSRGFDGFTKYPFVHYATLAVAYAPYLGWLLATGDLDTTARTVHDAFADPTASTTTIILMARVVSALMATCCVALLYVVARRLCRHAGAALAASAAFALCPQTALYAHVSTVDIPMMFWFAVAMLCYVRFADGMRPRDGLALGLATAVAVSTKEQIGGAFVLMAGLLLVRASRGGRPAAAARGLLRGALAFVLAFVLLNKIAVDPAGYADRIRGWLGAGTDARLWGGYPATWAGQFQLLAATGERLVTAAGWPLLALLAAGAAAAPWQRGAHGWWIAAPLASYYLFTLVPIRYVYSRFTLPILMLAALLCALGLARVFGRGGLPARCAALLVPLVLLLGAHRAWSAVDCLSRDPRYAAEAWLQARLPAGARVESYAYDHYLPRLDQLGLRASRVPRDAMTREAFLARDPDAAVLAPESWFKHGGPERRFIAWLRSGSGYGATLFEADARCAALFGADDRERFLPRCVVLVRPAAR
jgi:hypothetical protein